MLYFCVNTDYQLNLDKELIKNIDARKCLIQVPHKLDLDNTEGFDTVIKFDYNNILSFFRIIFHYPELATIKKNICERLKIFSKDVLLIHTDVKIVNAIIIERFYSVGCKIILLEDGAATLVDFNVQLNRINIKNKIRMFIIKYIYKLPNIYMVNNGLENQLRIRDKVFNGIIITMEYSIKRSIPIYKVNLKLEKLDIIFNKGAIFFNQIIYFYYCSEKDYILMLNEILSISGRFTPFYFKFHPSDSLSFKNDITKIIETDFPNISIINEQVPAEDIIRQYPVKYSISFTSTATLNLMKFGLIPVFLADILQQRKKYKDLDVFKTFLDSIECKYPASLDEVSPNYNSWQYTKMKSDSHSFNDILLEICKDKIKQDEF